MSEGNSYETVVAEVGDTSVLEEEGEDSFADIDDILSTRSDQGVGIRGAGMVRKRVEVVTRSGRRAACCVQQMMRLGWPSNRGRSTPQSKRYYVPLGFSDPY